MEQLLPRGGAVIGCDLDGMRVDVGMLKTAFLEFVDAYERRWGIKVDDESTWARNP